LSGRIARQAVISFVPQQGGPIALPDEPPRQGPIGTRIHVPDMSESPLFKVMDEDQSADEKK